MILPQISDYARLFISDIPMLDVRAPVEFSQGAFPHSYNAPLLNDEERAKVGTCYKQQGHDAAVELGTRLISGSVKEQRIASWDEFLHTYPQAVLYCFRGGMRSRITQQWIYEETGKMVPRVEGGYKALRRYLIEQTEILAARIQPLILSGRTGTGKTLLIRTLSNAIDLEGLANHRGSSFGRRVSPQPGQIGFENSVAIELLRHWDAGVTTIVLEDESPNIGSVHIPHPLFSRMQEAPCVVLETPVEQRIEITLHEYVVDMLEQFAQLYGDRYQGWQALSEYLHDSLDRIKRRLGGKAHAEIKSILDSALAEQLAGAGLEKHREWLRRMLVDYYDPMYDYQREKRAREVLKTANQNELIEFLRKRSL